jgi:hypothetical protein
MNRRKDCRARVPPENVEVFDTLLQIDQFREIKLNFSDTLNIHVVRNDPADLFNKTNHQRIPHKERAARVGDWVTSGPRCRPIIIKPIKSLKFDWG